MQRGAVCGSAWGNLTPKFEGQRKRNSCLLKEAPVHFKLTGMTKCKYQNNVGSSPNAILHFTYTFIFTVLILSALLEIHNIAVTSRVLLLALRFEILPLLKILSSSLL